MAILVEDLYDALKSAGVDDEVARKAARAVLGEEEKEHLATKANIHEMKSSIIQWNVGTMLALSGLFALITKFL